MNTEIIVITDKSGSMTPIRRSVIEGYNKFLKDQRRVEGEARVTFVTFSDPHLYEVVYQAQPLAKAPKLNLKDFIPDGMTALNDAIGRTLNEQGRRIAAEKWAERVIVCIITDGGENASYEYMQRQVREMITHAEKHDWRFVYLGANQDSFTVAQGYGISGQTTRNFVASAAGTMSAYAQTSDLTTQLRTGGQS